jgi:putative transposase
LRLLFSAAIPRLGGAESDEGIRVLDAQKAFILKQGGDEIPVADICHRAGISQATYSNWKKKYDGPLPTEMRRLKQLEDENGKPAELGEGIEPPRIVFETRASNTYQNALYSTELIKPVPSDHWLLVTGALHMPRAFGAFREVGFEVELCPVGDKPLRFPTHRFGSTARMPPSARPPARWPHRCVIFRVQRIDRRGPQLGYLTTATIDFTRIARRPTHIKFIFTGALASSKSNHLRVLMEKNLLRLGMIAERLHP